MDDAIPAVLNAQVDGEVVLGKGKTGNTGNETGHMRNMILNHSDVFACHVRLMLKGGEEDCKVGKGKLIGFYAVKLDIV